MTEARGQPRRQLEVIGLGVQSVAPCVRPSALQGGHAIITELLPALLVPRHGAQGTDRRIGSLRTVALAAEVTSAAVIRVTLEQK